MTSISFQNSDEFKFFTSKVCGHLSKTKLNQLRSAIAKELGHHHLSTFYRLLDDESAHSPTGHITQGLETSYVPIIGGEFESSYANLGFTAQQISDIQKLVDPRNGGAVIVSGTVATGKTKTARTLLENIIDIRSRSSDIAPRSVAIESERIVPAPHTTYFKPDFDPTGETLKLTLQSAARMAPDCLFVDEVRAGKAVKEIMSLIEAGFQIVTTIQAQDAFAIPGRLKVMGASNTFDHKLYSGFIHQALVKKLCKHCSLPINLKEDGDLYKDSVMRLIQATNMNGDYSRLKKRGHGCEHCSKGVSQLTVVAEVVPITEDLMNTHVSQGSEGARRDFIEKGGMTILDHAISKVLSGEVDPLDAESIIGSFQQYIHSDS